MQDYENKRRRRALIGIAACAVVVVLCLAINSCARAFEPATGEAEEALNEGQVGQSEPSSEDGERESDGTSVAECQADAQTRKDAQVALKSAQWVSPNGETTLIFHDYYFEELVSGVAVAATPYTIVSVSTSTDGMASIITCKLGSGLEVYQTTLTYRPASAEEALEGFQIALESEAFSAASTYLGHIEIGGI